MDFRIGQHHKPDHRQDPSIAKEWQQRPLESIYAVVFLTPFTTMSAARARS